MKVFVTGATGFTGSRVVPLLLKNEYEMRCLYRDTSDRSLLSSSEVEWALGDLSDTDALSASMRGADALVNLASLGFGHADSILRAARDAGIQRAIFISTTAIFTQLNAKSKQVRTAAELAIETSGLRYTILRPTMIYGSPRDRNMWRLIRFMRLSPIVPVFGDGKFLQQPIYVDDVAAAILGCLKSDATIGRSYNIAGKHPLTYNEVIDTIARLMNKRIWKLHVPSKPVVSLLALFERMRIPFPIKAEQVLRLNENKDFGYAEAQRDFGFNPLAFKEGIRMELKFVLSV
ncbi:MAG: NAD-dependent epimerase/dehydratase family protein [Anaerolineales bacterium]|nr:NAD-dependent epimerase/dehydratase family protein [Anaerolineales bacterium]NUQ85694.1 NAD-dependent epimerase/dehydratase family protein [Anaerolineales bacterium]